MRIFESQFGKVELTMERMKHIFQFHPEVKAYKKLFSKTLKHPNFTKKSKHDEKVIICYQRLVKNKFLAVVVKTNSRNFILTVYLTSKIQRLPV